MRDYRTMLVVLIIPVVLLLLFGFAISTEVNDVRVVAAVERHTNQSRQLLERLNANSYFTLCGTVAPQQAEATLRRGDADAAILISTDGGDTRYQIIADASNTVIAQTGTGYIESVIAGTTSPTVTMRTLYNPQLKSAYNFAPGILGMIFILICAIMTSVSIVSEKETGSMDLLLVSPALPRVIILGKLIPYCAISCIILTLMLAISYTVLGLPTANIHNVVWISFLYIVLALSIGLLVSTLVTSQISALIVSAVLFMLPVLMLSGMIFPIDNMPRVLQWISAIVPARWYVSAMRTLMIKQLPVESALTDVAVLASMTAVILTVAIKKLNSHS